MGGGIRLHGASSPFIKGKYAAQKTLGGPSVRNMGLLVTSFCAVSKTDPLPAGGRMPEMMRAV